MFTETVWCLLQNQAIKIICVADMLRGAEIPSPGTNNNKFTTGEY